ncbi:MAG: type II toxin-antitoxin system YafQ family toxin [Prevotellaceae bacterium]|jgi:mRNA interferase YafQ|nr:type II toxin-antitoxin system YafQ family toxin [Prevotellaceae bacterium]
MLSKVPPKPKYIIEYTNKFDKDLQKLIKRGYDTKLLYSVIEDLSMSGKLPTNYKPHKLKGEYAGAWECHIKPDWLLVWKQNDNELVLLMLATGTHSDLF